MAVQDIQCGNIFDLTININFINNRDKCAVESEAKYIVEKTTNARRIS